MHNDRQLPQPANELTIHKLDTLKVYFDPLRARIMQEMAHEPRTVHQVADVLGVPFTRLYYHVKLMEKHKLVRVVGVVQMPGAIEEKHYQVTARQFIIDRSLLTFDAEGKNDSVEYMLDGIFGASHRDVRRSIETGRIDVKAAAPDPKALLARKFIFRLTDEQATSFQHDLADLLLKYQSGETSSDDPYYSCLLALYRTSVPYESYDDSEVWNAE